MGATYDGSLTKKTSVLVCNSVSPGMKIKHAFEWNVPAVSAEWLWDCVRTGEVQSFGKYRIPAPKMVVKPSAPPRSNKDNNKRLREGERDAKEQIRVSSRRGSIGSVSKADKQARCDIRFTTGKSASSEPPGELDIAEPLVSTSTMESEENHSMHLGRDVATNYDGRSERGTPLQDISPEVNSSARKEISGAPEVPPIASGPDQQKGEDISDKIAELLRHQQGQLLRDQPPTSDHGRRPRCGLLGRAASNVSHASLSLALSGTSSVNADEAGGASPSLKNLNANSRVVAGDLELLSQERSHTLAEIPLASQVVTYEDPEAQRQKERVMRKLRGLEGAPATPKGKEKERKAVRSIGVARDSAAVKRSTRQKTYR
ncbi:hypothetical protein FGG08_000331 [Glutinoglossum americanum]|uniref:BRCT domain-containing protein n=1 Tax=Glutinoglossum americanum TaxID=1670608 RepID=A0A9P8L700_9PEZI|nr:hypothetical protein FGG08_000331 [Glutinoglossum americanum]